MSAETETVVADPTDTLFQARTHIARQMNDAYRIIGEAHQQLPHAMFQEPSKLGANRSRLSIAQDHLTKAKALVAEVGASVADLTFRPSVDSGEEG